MYTRSNIVVTKAVCTVLDSGNQRGALALPSPFVDENLRRRMSFRKAEAGRFLIFSHIYIYINIYSIL